MYDNDIADLYAYTSAVCFQ